MKKFKRLTAMALSVLMVLGLLAGCGSEAASSAPAPAEEPAASAAEPAAEPAQESSGSFRTRNGGKRRGVSGRQHLYGKALRGHV